MSKAAKKSSKNWSSKDIDQALAEIQSGQSIRSTASKYGMSEGTLRYRSKLLEKGETLQKKGRPTAFDEETERKLASCIGVMCKLGFSPTVQEILHLVSCYLSANSLLLSSFKTGKPGKDWFYAFAKRNNLSLKKAALISSARKSATANPFVVYDFYDQLDEIIKSNNLNEEQIWNCDESGFPSDPGHCRVVSEKGKVAYKVTCGAGRENTTTLAVCNAAGKCLDPFVIFTGKNLQSTWRGERALPGTWYGVSQNGWMTTELFDGWFKRFTQEIKTRPLLLIFDGHLTHVSISVIEKAIEENIILVKLPPHVTDKLQPLDVSCFGPLKRLWEKTLNSWINDYGPREPIRKAQFVNKLGDIWHKGLSPENIRAGFRATGVYPVDRKQFPVERFDTRLIKRYDAWVQAGRPKELLNDLATGVRSPKKASPQKGRSPSKRPMGPQATSTPSKTPVSNDDCPCGLAQKLGPFPCPAPPGKVWVPIWHLQDEPSPQQSQNRSFEELILEKMKGPIDQPKKKRRKIDLMTKVISDEDYLNAIKEKEEKQGSETVKRKRGRPKKLKADDDSFQIQEEVLSESEKESSDDDVSEDDLATNPSFPPTTQRQATIYLKEFWQSLCPPVEEVEIIGKWYAAIFLGKKSQQIYIGKVTKRFLADVDGPATGIELDCLKPHFGSGTVLEGIPSHLPRDIDLFDIENVFAGPLLVKPVKGNKWEVPDYEDVKRAFDIISKIDREHEYSSNFFTF
ncbi:uncharacterized protein LOC135690884 [Rhopilema esculentum]|uniref:uncharacterized protein LOC135690884 n=1 Tax=Rhopilema esculentum TaxID=499914 RepID=UPI0031CF2E89|eukprot:gene1748-16232_t